MAKGRTAIKRSRPQVLPNGSICLGSHALWDVAGIRTRWFNYLRSNSGRTGIRCSKPGRYSRNPFYPDRFRLQSIGCAFPHMGTRHLRGSPNPGHSFPCRSVQNCWNGRVNPTRLRRLPWPRRRRPALLLADCRINHDHRQPHRSSPEQYCSATCIFRRCPRRIYVGPIRRCR